ncbi:hypothetical protein N7495_009396 [Penicillium taxi]|uniref:uncharacterized protein n=1 Tax=Penicillium taxi TaxID=168475 RepID=UPI0025459F24|nr:uncharacterized protein N7495_009396 [Penicillium taxi]KAJ5884886.1 hypothetical protein N7495_009396 [Penicillium taxi]
MFPSRPPVKLSDALNISFSPVSQLRQSFGSKFIQRSAVRRGGGHFVDSFAFANSARKPPCTIEHLWQYLSISRTPSHRIFKMAARIPMSQVPAMFARRQPRVHQIARRLQSSSAPQFQNPAYPLYPSVQQLLHEKHVPESEVSKIPASGPKGRLLKGDVLAYLGQISSDYPATQAATLAKLAHLDLSNIKIAAPPAPKPAAPVVEEVIAKPTPLVSVAISVSLAAVLSAQKKLQDSLNVTVPLSRFLAVATDLANDDLPRSKNDKPSADELFDELLGAEPIQSSRGDFIPELNVFDTVQSARQPAPVKEDLIDFLSAKPGKRATAPAPVAEDVGVALNTFSLTVPVGEEVRAQEFLERIKTLLQVEPARLVL